MGQDEGPHVGDWDMIAELSWHRDYGLQNALWHIHRDPALFWIRDAKDLSGNPVTPAEVWPFKTAVEYRGEPSDPSYEWHHHLHPYDRYDRVQRSLEDGHFGASYLYLDEVRTVRVLYLEGERLWREKMLLECKPEEREMYEKPDLSALIDIEMAILIMEKGEEDGDRTRLCFCYSN